MSTKRILLFVVWVALVALPVTANATQGLWNNSISGTGKTGEPTKNADAVDDSDGQIWFDVSDADSDTYVTPITNVGLCENFSIEWWGDIADNTETANTLQCFSLGCDARDASNEDCGILMSGATLTSISDGDEDLSVIHGTDASQVYCVATMGASGGATFGRIRLGCWPIR
jgi:hypothetical protein